MTSLHGNSDRSDLDAYLDDALGEPQRVRMADEISGSRELQAEVALQKQIDESLRRSIVPAAIPESLLAALREGAPVARTVVPLRRRRMTLAVTATAATLVWAVLAWQYYSGSSNTSRYNPNLPLPMIYDAQVAAGFEPLWFCEDDREFASTFLKRQGQGLLLSAMPEGSKMVGLTYCGGISRYTTTMLARVDGAPVMVFVDRLNADTHPAPPAENSGLHLFRKELGPLVMYELTPYERPRVLDYLRAADVPSSES